MVSVLHTARLTATAPLPAARPIVSRLLLVACIVLCAFSCAKKDALQPAVMDATTIALDSAAPAATRISSLVSAAGAATGEADVAKLEEAIVALDSSGLLSDAESSLALALLEAQAAGRPAPGLHLALAAIYGRKGLAGKAYVAIEAAEAAARMPGVGFSIAAIHGRKALLAPSGPGACTLSVSCDNAGASLSVDGLPAIAMPAFLEAMRPGKHELAISLEGYDTLVSVVEGAEGAVVTYKAALEPALVPLSVTTDPAGATVSIDGEPVGPSPWSGTARPGTRMITASLAGYAEATSALPIAVSSLSNEASLKLAAVAKKPAISRAAVFTVAKRGISVDGRIDDWAGIKPVCVDPAGDDGLSTWAGTDISAVYLAYDDKYVYARIDLADGSRRDIADESSDYTVYLMGNPVEGGGNTTVDLNVIFDVTTGKWASFITRFVVKGGKSGLSNKISSDFLFKHGDSCIELRALRNVIGKYFTGAGPFTVWADYSVWKKWDTTNDVTAKSSFTFGW